MKVCICDDEVKLLEEIKSYLISINNKYIIKTFENTKELQKEIRGNDIDILFMDIKLKDSNGIDFIKNNEQYLNNTKLIYITGYTEYVEDIFETNPIYFLQKPINKEKIQKALKKVEEMIKKENEYISIKVKKEIVKINTKDIYYIESNARSVNIYLANNVYTTYEKLSTFENILSSNFIRIHKSFLVNINKITKYKNNKITLENGTVLNISRTYTKNCRDNVLKFLLGR